MGETVDVLVVGTRINLCHELLIIIISTAGNYGSRKRSGGVSTLICAVFDDKLPDEEEPK